MNEFILVLCWLGVAQSALLGLYFVSNAKLRINYLFLGLMLLMIGIRVAKSTIYMFNPDPALYIMNVGFAAHAMLGPLFLFYILTLNQSKPPRYYLIYFFPALIIALLSTTLELNSFWYKGGYSVLLYYTLAYLVVGWFLYLRDGERERFNRVIIFLLVTLSFFQISYFTNYILRLTPYETGAIIHSLLIYVISFLVLKNNNVFNLDKKKKYTNLNLTPEEVERFKQKIVQVMEKQKPYLQTNFSLSQCAELTGIPGHILSYVLSESLKQNFLHFVNTYRIEEAKVALLDSRKQHLSIAGIAIDCGFNSLSSFNTAFKKFTGTTPSNYKKKQVA
ncbi:MAG: helix-turn-helix domain-containing protein [Cyclobacteriaceae bacterium]